MTTTMPRKAIDVSAFIDTSNVPLMNLTSVGRALKRWGQLIADLSHADVELEVCEVAPVLATFKQLRRAGVVFDPMLTLLIGKLEQQCKWRDSDPDADASGMVG